MKALRTPQEVLADIPGWHDAAVSELEGGCTNRVWLVKKDTRRAVLKIDEKLRDEPFNSRRGEAEIQALAADWGIASTVLHVDDDILLAKYAEGEVWHAGHLESFDNLAILAQALRRLHSLPLTGRLFDAIGAARTYAAETRNADDPMVGHCVAYIGAQSPPENLRCCHNDLVAGNIIATPVLRFLDWEYACDNEPLYDLASMVEYHDLNDDLTMHLLDAYFDGAGERHLEQLREQRRLYRALLWLWLAMRPDRDEDELDSVAERIDF